MSNHFVHHGRAGLQMLGFEPEKDTQQIPMDFLFDDDAETRSKTALRQELPLLINRGLNGGIPTSLGSLFTSVCNDTPATIKQISDVLVDLRDEKEIEIVTKEGRPKPRAGRIQWTDIIIPARQHLLFTGSRQANRV